MIKVVNICAHTGDGLERAKITRYMKRPLFIVVVDGPKMVVILSMFANKRISLKWQ